MYGSSGRSDAPSNDGARLEGIGTVRVVPSLEQVVSRECGQFFSSDPEGTERTWAEALTTTWRNRRGQPLPHLDAFFSGCGQPYASALRLVLLCAGGGNLDFSPKTLPYLIIDGLRRWAGTVSAQPNPHHLKIVAFNIATEQKNASFIRLIADVYCLYSERDILLPHVETMLENNNYKLACQCVVIFDLQDHFSQDRLLVPLLLQDKISLIEDYLDSFPERAFEFVKYLDDLVKNKSIVGKIQFFLVDTPVPDVKWEKLYHKPMGKLIVRLCKKYNISVDNCENLSHMRAFGGIRFLVRQRYEENVLSENAWNDLITDTVTNNPDLLKELVCMLVPYDAKEALKWAKTFNLSKELYPEDLFPYEFESQDGEAAAEDETWDTSPGTSSILNYRVLPISMDDVVIVDELTTFEKVILQDLANVSVIGLDSEWKPSFGAKPSSVSLIQLATQTNVYIFDVLTLNKSHRSNFWSLLTERIFNNPNVTKFGFGLDNDMREITTSVPGLSGVKYKGYGYLELGQLWKSFQNTQVQFPFPKVNVGEGLNSIVEQCFGTCLNKNEQCSNWENRPLRTSQIQYAALDAYVLIEIYELLSNLSSKYNINYDDMCYQVMEKSGQSKTRKKRTKEKLISRNLYSKQLIDDVNVS